MRDRFSHLRGRCPGSDEQVGAQYAGKRVACQTCNREIQVSARGVVHSHLKNCFHYLSTARVSGELIYTGLEYDSAYFGFAAGGWDADRFAVRMALPLSELKRLHEFLGSEIREIEEACASNPAFHAQVKGADYSVKHGYRPQIVY